MLCPASGAPPPLLTDTARLLINPTQPLQPSPLRLRATLEEHAQTEPRRYSWRDRLSWALVWVCTPSLKHQIVPRLC